MPTADAQKAAIPLYLQTDLLVPSTPLQDLLVEYRTSAQSEREKGDSFEKLVQTYLRIEPQYRELYGDRVWLWEQWRNEAAKRGLSTDIGGDTGIDLVAEPSDGELHAIQAKFYDDNTTLSLNNLSTFLAAVGHTHYFQGYITTATKITANLRQTLQQQKTPIRLITLYDLDKSIIDWSQFSTKKEPVLKPQKTPRPHQHGAIGFVATGLEEHDRGKLIMACGTGKTYTALKIVERMVPPGGSALFLVPSLSLLSQTLTEWTQDATVPLHSFAVCSDEKVGKKEDPTDPYMLVHELQYPATTDPAKLATKARTVKVEEVAACQAPVAWGESALLDCKPSALSRYSDRYPSHLAA